jgi:hypothetical protein
MIWEYGGFKTYLMGGISIFVKEVIQICLEKERNEMRNMILSECILE